MTAQPIDFAKPRPFLAGVTHSWGQDIARFARRFMTCLDVARQRRHLLALDESVLKDIGVRRADAVSEANRGFWDIAGVPGSNRR